MPKGFWIAHIDVTDPEHYPDYIAASTAAISSFGGKFIIRGGENTQAEGQLRSRHILVEFSSYQQALDCYQSEEYQQAKKLRQAYADSDILIVQGAD